MNKMLYSPHTGAVQLPDAGHTANVEEFAKMVDRHDLTYEYSDDGRCWRAGQGSLDAIVAFRARLSWSVAREIWNAAVDRKMGEGSRAMYHWPEEEPK